MRSEKARLGRLLGLLLVLLLAGSLQADMFSFSLQVGDASTEIWLKVDICEGQRVEDSVHSAVELADIATQSRPAVRQKVVNAFCNTLRHTTYANISHEGCDDRPPNKIIGVVEQTFFVRVGYNAVDTYLCFCEHFECDENQITRDAFRYINETLNFEKGIMEKEVEHNKSHPDVPVVKIQEGNASTCDSNDIPAVGVSLGVACQSAITAASMGLRHRKEDGYRTCPFDLMLSNYDGMVAAIKDDFQYFTDSRYLEVFEVKNEMKQSLESKNAPFYRRGDRLIRNSYYNFIFNHESPAHIPYSLEWKNGVNHFIANDFYLFKERYNRRINNFRHYMMNSSNVLFFLTAPILNTTLLEMTLRHSYPLLKFRVHVFLVNSYNSANFLRYAHESWMGSKYDR